MTGEKFQPAHGMHGPIQRHLSSYLPRLDVAVHEQIIKVVAKDLKKLVHRRV